jgi:4'-phosphopantetheinyl transferase EntD
MPQPCKQSTSITEATLATLLHGLLPPGATAAARRIRSADGALLTTEERASLEPAADPHAAARGAGRHIARQLCATLGVPTTAIARHPSGMPLFPPGVAGSIAHDEEFSVAVAAPGERYDGIGVDIEPPGPVEGSLLALIATPAERAMLRATGCPAKALFCIKESVFKAVYPRDRIFLEYSGIRVDLHHGIATAYYGRQVFFRALTLPQIIAISWWTN